MTKEINKPEHYLQVADIVLQSSEHDVAALAGVLLKLLEDNSIREYLGIVNSRKIKKEVNNYCG